MTSLSGTVSRMLREVMFASGVWYCVLVCVSQAAGALAIVLAVIGGLFQAPQKSILSTETFLADFGPSAGATRRLGARLAPGTRESRPYFRLVP